MAWKGSQNVIFFLANESSLKSKKHTLYYIEKNIYLIQSDLSQMLLIGILPSHYYFIQISMVDIDKQIIFIGNWHLKKMGIMDKNTVWWNEISSDIERVPYRPSLSPSSYF